MIVEQPANFDSSFLNAGAAKLRLHQIPVRFETCEPSSCPAGRCRALGGERFALWGAPGAL